MAASRTYKTRAIVLRKVKLGEKDLVVSMLAETGELVRAVAKGARKPGSSLAARTELFSVVDAMLAQGRSLDVLTEARLAAGRAQAKLGLEQAACAAPIAELICNVAQEGLEHPRLFDMTLAAADALAGSDAPAGPAITAAALLKVLASAGFRPSFEVCVACGSPLALNRAAGRVAVSFEEGGVVCGDCARAANCVLVEAATLTWSHALLYARFAEVAGLGVSPADTFAVLQFARSWARTHTGRDVKSLDFLFTGGLF